MIRVGVVGLGMMGHTHLEIYHRRDDSEVLAVADADPDRLSGKTATAANIERQAASGFDLARTRRFDDGLKLIDAPDIDLVDICLPTPLHRPLALAALAAGKHVLVEKPLARTSDEADQIVAAAQNAPGIAMTAMCMRFWPAWEWLKGRIDEKSYGNVLGAQFRRVASLPPSPFYRDGERCGGAVLDMHIHDTDFIQHCFGIPKAVLSRGYRGPSGKLDHLVTLYEYDDVPLVVAEGGWAMAEGFGFTMQYTVNFERATAKFNLDEGNNVTLVEPGKDPQTIDFGPALGYEREIAYLLGCIERKTPPTVVTLEEAADSVRIVEAEVRSIESGDRVVVDV